MLDTAADSLNHGKIQRVDFLFVPRCKAGQDCGMPTASVHSARETLRVRRRSP